MNTLAWPMNTSLLLDHAEAARQKNSQMLKKKKKNQHLHDDGFLGHFSLLFSDYKENSMNSMGLKKAKAEMIKLSLLSSSTSTGMKNNQLYHPIHAFCGYFQHNL